MKYSREIILQILQSGGKAGENMAKAGDLPSFAPDEIQGLPRDVKIDLAEHGLFLDVLIFDKDLNVSLVALHYVDFETLLIKEEDLDEEAWYIKEALAKHGRFLDILVFDWDPGVSLAAFNHPDFDASLIRSEDVGKLCKEVRELLAQQGFLLGTLMLDKNVKIARIAVSHPDFDITDADQNLLASYAELAPSFLEERGILASPEPSLKTAQGEVSLTPSRKFRQGV